MRCVPAPCATWSSNSRIRPAVFRDLSGVTVDHVDERAIELTVEGLMGELVAAAAAHGAIDIVSRPADLDEVFLTYYGEGER